MNTLVLVAIRYWSFSQQNVSLDHHERSLISYESRRRRFGMGSSKVWRTVEALSPFAPIFVLQVGAKPKKSLGNMKKQCFAVGSHRKRIETKHRLYTQIGEKLDLDRWNPRTIEPKGGTSKRKRTETCVWYQTRKPLHRFCHFSFQTIRKKVSWRFSILTPASFRQKEKTPDVATPLHHSQNQKQFSVSESVSQSWVDPYEKLASSQSEVLTWENPMESRKGDSRRNG